MLLKILSYNIHKGLGPGPWKKQYLRQIRDAIHEVQPDIAFLQEVVGKHDGYSRSIADWPTRSQTEYLAEGLWPHFSYGKNAVYTHGHHGNAILSKFPLRSCENIDISKGRYESRGLLHAVIDLPGHSLPLHAICTHLGLFEGDRGKQLQDLSRRLRKMAGPAEPVVVGGDFNDWREKTSSLLLEEVGLKEVFLSLNGEHAKTFPIWLPMLRLDRIYSRGFVPESARCLSESPWNELSDHAALTAVLELSSETVRPVTWDTLSL